MFHWYVVTKLCFAPLERGKSFRGLAFYKHLAPNGAKTNNVLLQLVHPHGQDGAYSEVAAARLFRCFLRVRVEKKLAHLARRIA